MRDEDLRRIIRKNLILLRTQKGATQAEIGKLVGKSINAVGSWEQGLSLPDICTLYQLAKFYGVPIESIFEDTSITE